MSLTPQLFDIAEYLETEGDITGFLQEVAEIGNTFDFIHALVIVARARSMNCIMA